MRLFLSIFLIIFFAIPAEYFGPWWLVAIVAFLVTGIVKTRPSGGFWAGFFGIGIFWLIFALLQDGPNHHILSSRMAALFHLPGYPFFIGLTVLLGAIVGGLSGWSGAVIRKVFISPTPNS